MSRRVRRQASLWLVRMQAETVEAADRDAFEAWCRADPRHAEAFDALARTIGRVRRLRDQIDSDDGIASAAPSPSRRRLLAAAGASGVATASAAAGLWWASRQGFERIETATGVQHQALLGDGSRVELNTRTRIEVRLSASRRQVRFTHGEALFAVAQDTARPFEVEVGGHILRAEGTQFIVRHDNLAFHVLVLEGAVSVAGYFEARQRLGAGQRLDLHDGRALTSVSEADIARGLAWRSGMLHFDRDPLSAVVAEVERHTGVAFAFAEADIARLEMAAYFPAKDLSAFVRMIETSYPMLHARRTASGYLIERRDAGAP